MAKSVGVIRRKIGAVLDRVTSFVSPNRGGAVFLGRDKISGVYLNEYEALRLAAVWACICVIAKTLAASAYSVYQEAENGDRTGLPNSRTHYLLNVRPNPEMTPIAFFEALMIQALVWGKSFAEIEFDGVGRPAALWPIDPDRGELVRGFKIDGRFEYNDKGKVHLRVTNLNGPDTFLEYDEILHILGVTTDGMCGLNMVSVAARPLLMMLASEKFRLAFYQHGTSLGGVLSSEQALDGEKLDELKASVKGRISGVENAFQFLVLGSGMTWQSLTQDFDKQQFLELNYFMIEETCRYWDVPPHIIHHLLRSTFNNIEHLGIEFVRRLRPWKLRLTQELDFKLLPVGPFGLDLDLAWAAEGDAKSVAETLGILADHGFIMRDEGRRKLGYNATKTKGANVLTVQSNMTTLDRVESGENLKSQKTGAATQDDPNAPKKPGEGAAKGLVFAAIRRGLQRQNTRVQNCTFKDRPKFEKWIARTVATDTQYTNDQVNEALAYLDGIGVKVVSRRAGVVEEMCFETGRLLLKAFDERQLAAWCDIEGRAKAAVEALELKVEERGE